MSSFRTIVPIKPIDKPFSYNDRYFLMGSCFAENMGSYLKTYQFKNMINPFGIVFNLASLDKLIHRMINLEDFEAFDLFKHHDVWSCFEVHSNQNKIERSELLNHLNQKLHEAHHFLKHTQVFILTIGTSWVYKNILTAKIVANCHKLPANQFEKILLEPSENANYLNHIIQTLQVFNPKIKIILTVSPIRHIKDGFFENNVSKANILSAIYQQNSSKVNYFPSFEIMQDDLRDYRFYAEDMLHPNEIATKYIWQKFKDNYFSQTTVQTMKEVETVNKMKCHRPFLDNTKTHLDFLNEIDQKILKLQSTFDWFFKGL